MVWTPTADIAAISAGAYHNLAQLADGTVWAWGSQDWYQCGQPEYVDQLTPAKVLDLEQVVAISAGGWHSLALMPDGTVRAWGANNEGQRGVGSKSANVYSPPASVVNLQDVTAISAGGQHSVALVRDGTVRAWGSQDWYQVGIPAWVDKAQPTEVLELVGVSAISAGGWHSLALLGDGTVRGWGANNYGQLGGGTTWGNRYHAPVQAANLNGVKAVATGSHHSLALREDGTVWAWGANGWGQLGDGTNQHRNRPVQVADLEGVTAIASGSLQDWSHHSVALREDGTLWAWGYNGYGQLGDGTTQSRSRPAQVIGVKGVSVFDAGGCHTIAIA
jgi:alpha-tubulin suppressor-like RCC1 family protein